MHAYLLGVITGLGIRPVEPDSTAFINQPAESIRTLLGDVISESRFGATMRLSYNEYKDSLGHILDGTDSTARKYFAAGFIQSAGVWASGVLKVSVDLSETGAKIERLLSEVSIPSEIEENSHSNQKIYHYGGVAAMDMLNCVSIRHNNGGSGMYIGASGDDKEAGRHDLNAGFKSPYSSNIMAMLYSRLRADSVAPTKSRASDAGYDITITYVSRVLDSGVILYGTGLAVEPPFGYYFDLVPRSSISKTGYEVANSVGIIDPTYRGEVLVALRKVDPNAADLELPVRIAQLIPRPIVHMDAIEVNLSDTARDTGGFGSTGA